MFVYFCLSHRLADSLLAAVDGYRPWSPRSLAEAKALNWVLEFQEMALDHVRIPADDDGQRSFLLLNVIEFVGQHQSSYSHLREIEKDAMIRSLFENAEPAEPPMSFDGWEVSHVGKLWLSLALTATTSISGKKASRPNKLAEPRERHRTESQCGHFLRRDIGPVMRRDNPDGLFAFLGEGWPVNWDSARVVGNFPGHDQVSLFAAAAYGEAPTLLSMLPRIEPPVAVHLAAGLPSSAMLEVLSKLGVEAPDDAFLSACRVGSLECMRDFQFTSTGCLRRVTSRPSTSASRSE
jgi:hypothetical protein